MGGPLVRHGNSSAGGNPDRLRASRSMLPADPPRSYGAALRLQLILFLLAESHTTTIISMILLYIIGAVAAWNVVVYLLDRASKRAEERRARERAEEEQRWHSSIEPAFRTHPTYPPDWERRRALIFIRDHGCCSRCGAEIGDLSCAPERVFGFDFGQRLLRGADVHHEEPVSHGGTHALENLILICDVCHAKKHPDNEHMRARVGQRTTWRFPNSRRPQWGAALPRANAAPKERDDEVPF
jgi:5-methylcytosine-specific restriction endonuclease McrA